jgi:hypothetical protein
MNEERLVRYLATVPDHAERDRIYQEWHELQMDQLDAMNAPGPTKTAETDEQIEARYAAHARREQARLVGLRDRLAATADPAGRAAIQAEIDRPF